MQYIDAAMVGRLGAVSSASIGLVAAVTWLMGGVTSAVSYGYSVQVAQGLGAGEGERVRNVVRQGLLVLLGFSSIIGIIVAIFANQISYLMGGSGQMAEQAAGYLRCFAIFLPAVQFMHFGSALLQASGDMKTPGLLLTLMCIEDVIFNALLIFPVETADKTGIRAPFGFGAGLGVTGAALGTCLAYLLTAGIMLYFACIRSEALHFRKSDHYQFDWGIIQKANTIGGPMAFEEIALCGAQIVSTTIVAPLGTVAVAAHSFAITAEAVCYMPGYGLEGAASTLVGQSYGAGKKKLAKSFGWITIALGMSIMAAAGFVMYFLCPFVFRFLTPVAEVQALGVACLRIELLAEALFGAAIVAAGALRGAGDTMIPAGMSLLSMWGVRLTLAAVLSRSMGLRGVWIAMAIELSFRGIIFLIRFGRSKYLTQSEKSPTSKR
jgi:putative MATE family efflux protein